MLFANFSDILNHKYDHNSLKVSTNTQKLQIEKLPFFSQIKNYLINYSTRLFKNAKNKIKYFIKSK